MNNIQKLKLLGITSSLLLGFVGCAGVNSSTIDNSPGRKTVYQDINTINNDYAGVGIESQDIASMTDKMVRDLLSSPQIAARKIAPRIIIDEKYFKNQSASRINKGLITERIMVNLNRASHGRMIFLERDSIDMVEKERALKRAGTLSEGSLGSTDKIYGADFRMSGKIMSLEQVSNAKGGSLRYHQISFKMVDLETGALVWTGIYEFAKASESDIVYR
jgi:hypothetical protein